MNCRTVRTSATTPHDAAMSQAVAAHLATCEACQDELGELPALFAAPPLIAPPPNFAAHLMARLPETPAVAAVQARRRQTRRLVMRGLWVALALAFVALGAFGLFVDSSAPAAIVGGPETSSGRAALALTLAGKPMVAVMLQTALPMMVALLIAGTVGIWAWRRLAQPLPALVLGEIEQ